VPVRSRWKSFTHQLAGRLHMPGAMTRYDRTWEPLFVLIAAATLWFGTL
jgi:hypothetical protein